MNGPNVVCIACGSVTSVHKPFCDDCARFFVAEVGHMPFCVLCHEGYPLQHGMHTTKTGGYAGRCAVNQEAKP
jgi:molybdenum cofactor biosynthesis enzyme MoaA